MVSTSNKNLTKNQIKTSQKLEQNGKMQVELKQQFTIDNSGKHNNISLKPSIGC